MQRILSATIHTAQSGVSGVTNVIEQNFKCSCIKFTNILSNLITYSSDSSHGPMHFLLCMYEFYGNVY